MYHYTWYHWLTFFYIYCVCGWIFESTYVSLKSHRFINRGFLRLPMLPLYGTGAVVILWASLPFRGSLLLVYLSGVVAATLLEYVTGYFMERLFKMRYWDYSNQKLQLHGYICLSSSIAWGFLTIFLTDVIHEPIARFVLSWNPIAEFTFLAVISCLFVSDAIKSTKEALDLGHALETMTKVRAELEEVQVQLALLRAETVQKVTESMEGKMQRVAHHASTLSESALAERLKALNEKQQKMAQQMSFYRKELLRGNPTAASKRFANALKDLKEAVNSRRN